MDQLTCISPFALGESGRALVCLVCRRKVEPQKPNKETELERWYALLFRTKEQIESQMGGFYSALYSAKDNPGSEKYRSKALEYRQRLLDLFLKFETIGKKIAVLPIENDSDRRLKMNIMAFVGAFLQENMFTLQFIPKEPKEPKKQHQHVELASSSHPSSSPSLSPSRSFDSPSRLLSFAKGMFGSPAASPRMEDTDQIQSQLQVLLEQRSLLESTAQEFLKQRRLDDVQTIRRSIADLDLEIRRLKVLLT